MFRLVVAVIIILIIVVITKMHQLRDPQSLSYVHFAMEVDVCHLQNDITSPNLDAQSTAKQQ